MESKVFGVLDSDPGTISLLENAGTSQPEERHELGPTILRTRSPKPAWWLLYAVLPLTVFLFMLAGIVPATSGWRSASELLAALVILCALGLWLRVNRIALIVAEYSEQSDSNPEFP